MSADGHYSWEKVFFAFYRSDGNQSSGYVRFFWKKKHNNTDTSNGRPAAPQC